MEDHTAQITKTNVDRYHLIVRDGVTTIEEDIDGPKLLAMIGNDVLVNGKGEVVTSQAVLLYFDKQPVGKIVIGMQPKAL